MWKLRHWEVQWFAQSPTIALGFEPRPSGSIIPIQIPIHSSLNASTPVHTVLSLKASSIIWRSFYIRAWRAVLFFLTETLNEHINFTLFSSVKFSRSIVFDSLQPRGLQHARPPCPWPTPELAQTHVHWVTDAIQPSHPQLSPPPPAFNLSQHQPKSLFRFFY